MLESAGGVVLAETVLPEPADCTRSLRRWAMPKLATDTL